MPPLVFGTAAFTAERDPGITHAINLSLWIFLITEVGVVSFLTKTGPFAWDGIFVFWLPALTFFGWCALLGTLVLRALKRQAAAVPALG